jgi:hypothetical protein
MLGAGIADVEAAAGNEEANISANRLIEWTHGAAYEGL